MDPESTKLILDKLETAIEAGVPITEAVTAEIFAQIVAYGHAVAMFGSIQILISGIILAFVTLPVFRRGIEDEEDVIIVSISSIIALIINSSGMLNIYDGLIAWSAPGVWLLQNL